MCWVSQPRLRNLVLHLRVGEVHREALRQPPSFLLRYIRPEGKHESRQRRRTRRLEKRRRLQGLEEVRTAPPPPRVTGDLPRMKKNFYVFGHRSLSFTVFPKSGHVIVTGVRDHCAVDSVLRRFSRALRLPVEEVRRSAKVVNSTFDGHICCEWEGGSACQALARFKRSSAGELHKRDVQVSFRSQFFPGARVRYKDLGTVNLFNNGKYILVGVKEGERAQTLHREICAIMRTYWTTSAQPTSCAWTADSSWTG